MVEVSPLSQELVIGLVGYVGAGCSTATSRLEVLLQVEGYEVEVIKLSNLIAQRFGHDREPIVGHGIKAGPAKFERACKLQDSGDELRGTHQHHAVAALAIAEIMARRGAEDPGKRASSPSFWTC